MYYHQKTIKAKESRKGQAVCDKLKKIEQLLASKQELSWESDRKTWITRNTKK